MKNIGRVLFWFKDENNNELLELHKKFFPLCILLNRLLNKKYLLGKKIKFINIFFYPQSVFDRFPKLLKNYVHFYNGHLSYSEIWDNETFYGLSEYRQNHYLWKKAFEILILSSKELKNNNLLEASEYAYEEGIKLKLNANFKLLTTEALIKEKIIEGSLWIRFKENVMYSVFSIAIQDRILYEKDIDSTEYSVEFFLEMYKKLDYDNNLFIIRGAKDVEYLPLKISIPDNLL
jgi:hypothetical protein